MVEISEVIGGNEYILASTPIIQSQLPSQTKITFSPTSSEVKVKFKYGTSAWTWHGHSICIMKPVMVSETYYVDVCDGGEDKYRFGFNGMEKDNEMKGIGNSLDFKFRIYDSRLGRFLSQDPLHKDFPWNSTYAFAENDVILNLDLEGAEKYNYIMTMTKQGNIELKLSNTTNIVDKVVVGYRVVSYGSGIETPIYETRVNQRQEYTINGRNASWQNIQEIQGTISPAPIIQAGMDKIKRDYVTYNGQFSQSYYVSFGRFLFEQSFKNVKQNDYVKSAATTWEIVNNKTWTKGSTLFHLYESFVRQNDNTGYDKLLHFTASAYYTIKYGEKTSKLLGWSKEAFGDWMLGDGWDDNDMRANRDGINYGKTVNNAVENNTGEFEFCDDTCN